MLVKLKFVFPALLLYFALVSCSKQVPPTATEDQFSKHIRTSEALSPEEERAQLQVPPGFEIQLFASEPDIGKPLNMAFDARGRMWLTQSFDYPFPDTTGASKDRISILEDTDGDGQADRFTVFADSLNIPIGIVPVPDGAIAYSIPHIYHFIDRNGDDRVDERKVLIGGFQYKDTHGMINNLVRSWDGWIHADHGFANVSTVAGSDGDSITLNSGNTFRFRMDGSRIEFTTTGRVNPYGYAYDEWGYTYSADCHSSPIYQLVRGADYPHFGKQPTGIGFGPALMPHNYGSTALAGLEFYLGDQFPAEYQNSFYLGDVVKCRVYRSTMEMQGTTPQISWEDEFVVSKDPWFRPVDVKLGPDGALYIADFYNRIIGHYEVPLDHEGRDRHRGRIWRIVYNGEGKTGQPTNWYEASLDELIAGLNHPNLPLRMRIADEIVDRFGTDAVPSVLTIAKDETKSVEQRVQTFWTLYRLNALRADLMTDILQGQDPVAKVHMLRIAFEQPTLNSSVLRLAAAALQDPNPHIQRQAVMVVSKHPAKESLNALLDLQREVAPEDTHLGYSIKQSLRDHLREPDLLAWVLQQDWAPADAGSLADAAMGVNTANAGRFLLRFLERNAAPEEKLKAFTQHIARYLPRTQQDDLVKVLRTRNNAEDNLSFALYKSMTAGLEQSGATISPAGREWGTALAGQFLKDRISAGEQWKVLPDEFHPYSANPWSLVAMKTDDGGGEMMALTSGQSGVRDVSTIYSPSFKLTGTLTFDLFGHKNPPNDNQTVDSPTNKIELRLVDDDSVIQEAEITGEHQHTKIQWSIGEHEGQQAYLALMDQSNAWGEFIGIGGMPPDLPLPTYSPKKVSERHIFAAGIVGDFGVKELLPLCREVVSDQRAESLERAACLKALLENDPSSGITAAQPIFANSQEPLLLKEKAMDYLSQYPGPASFSLLQKHLGELSYGAQKSLLLTMMDTPEGIDALLEAAEELLISPRLLLERQLQLRFAETVSRSQSQKLAAITADIKPPTETTQALIDKRVADFGKVPRSIAAGREIYTTNCSACHQISGEGGNIGPQLDAIGNWGTRALAEKILDPNRNISKAFMNYEINLRDGQQKIGLFRREEGQLLVFADITGSEFSLDKDQVANRKLSPYTLMPDHFGEIIAENDFHDLLAFLLNEK